MSNVTAKEKSKTVETKQVAKFKVFEGKLVVAAVGNYLASRFGNPLAIDDDNGKTHHKNEIAAKVSTGGMGILIKENSLATLNAIANSATVEEALVAVQDSINRQLAIGHAFTEGKAPAAMVKYAGTRLDNVTTEKQAQERVEIETFTRELHTLASHRFETEKV
jgi:hypothetical protein